MWIASTIAECRQHRRSLGGRVVFVPTMGALHAGHLSLIEGGRKLGDHVLVSIFVNPTQFAPHEDFERYPRPAERDIELCRETGATGVFHPAVSEMYPTGRPACEVAVPELAAELEGAARPGHFAGVCRIVAKLFNIVEPHVACFGQKDYQQLKVIEAMVADLDMPITIAGLPIVREPDGLAMSSRNVYLSPEQRRQGLALFKALSAAKMMIEDDGETDPRIVEAAMKQAIEAHHVGVDYAVVRHPQTLAKIDCIEPALSGGVAALVAGRVGPVRLLDNMLMARRGD